MVNYLTVFTLLPCYTISHATNESCTVTNQTWTLGDPKGAVRNASIFVDKEEAKRSVHLERYNVTATSQATETFSREVTNHTHGLSASNITMYLDSLEEIISIQLLQQYNVSPTIVTDFSVSIGNPKGFNVTFLDGMVAVILSCTKQFSKI